MIYNLVYFLFFDFNFRFWYSLCIYVFFIEVNDEGNFKIEIGVKNDDVNFVLIYKLIEYLGKEI